MKYCICIACIMLVAAGTARGDTRKTYRLPYKHTELTKDSIDTESKFLKTNKEAMKQEIRMISREEVPGLRKWERKKSAKTAMICAMLLPGLGELYNGRKYKTVIMVCLSTFYMGKIWIEHKNAQRRKIARDSYNPGTFNWRYENLWYDYHKERTRDYAWWSGAIWFIGILDSYVDAHLHDVRMYRPSTGGKAAEASYLSVTIRF